MTAAEEGVLLLCCHLGDPNCKPLTMARFRDLGLRVRASGMDGDPLSKLTAKDLCRLNYSVQDAEHIIDLLQREKLLHTYLAHAEKNGIHAITRISPHYPKRITHHKKYSSPPVLFVKGDVSLLDQPSVSVVGSRQLFPENKAFAKAIGTQAASEGLVLVSGGAVGADQTAQNACLQAGGSCILFVPDRLIDYFVPTGCLYISECGYDLPFSPARALSRNHLIHMQGDKVIVVQCTYGKGGTWEGSIENLKQGWSPMFVFDDGTKGSIALMERGATGIGIPDSIRSLSSNQITFF